MSDKLTAIDIAKTDKRPSSMLAGTSGITISWRNVSVQVPIKKKQSKTILFDNCGYVQPGEILFIVGSSGSGKSTLLDTLANRTSYVTTGVQYLNDQKKTTTRLREVAKYVQQEDDLTGVLTVYETLKFNADLYLNLSAEKKEERVNNVIQLLGLSRHRDTKVGNAFFRGLSGGQKRRVTIGCELLANPNVLFLDECTTGLDSATAIGVMKELKKIAIQNDIAMVITIHQPSQRLFELCDKVLIISGGRTCYFGNSAKAISYFTNIGYLKPISQSNIEWLLDLVNKDFGDKELQLDHIINQWEKSKEYSQLQSTLDQFGLPKYYDLSSSSSSNRTNWKENYPISMMKQVSILTKRGILNAIRNPAVLWLRFAMYLILAITMGLVWLRLGTKASMINSTIYAFYIVGYMMFMSVSVLPAYLEERSILIRERLNGAYSIGSYIIAHTIYEIPYVFFLSFVISLIVYFMVGLTPSFQRFLIYFANLFLSLFVSESIMVLIAATIPWLIIGIATSAMINGLFMCVQGIFISIHRIGWWLRWAKYIALHFYSYSTYMVNQFKDTTYTADPVKGFPVDIKGEDVYATFGLEERLWVNFVALIVMIIVYRALAAFWLHRYLKVTN